jgi:putative aldouronate transport system substrate-binding protein
MNKGKRMQLSVAVIAAFALVAAGCGGKSTGASSDSAAKAGEGGGAGQAPEKRGSITVSLYDRGSVPADEGTMDNNRWTKWVNENGPVDVKYVTVPRWESIQKFNVMFRYDVSEPALQSEAAYAARRFDRQIQHDV